jgi:hypothetical protein
MSPDSNERYAPTPDASRVPDVANTPKAPNCGAHNSPNAFLKPRVFLIFIATEALCAFLMQISAFHSLLAWLFFCLLLLSLFVHWAFCSADWIQKKRLVPIVRITLLVTVFVCFSVYRRSVTASWYDISFEGRVIEKHLSQNHANPEVTIKTSEGREFVIDCIYHEAWDCIQEGDAVVKQSKQTHWIVDGHEMRFLPFF